MNEIRIDWLTAGDATPALLRESEDWLRADERERVARFLRPAPRRDYLLGRWLARRALTAWTGVPPPAWWFELGPHGRPEPRCDAMDVPRPSVNISHGGDLVVCASAIGIPVGVDVEPEDREVPDRLYERFFAPDEAGGLRALPEAARLDRFWRLWTLKEAWLKARGTGVAGGLASFSIRFRDPEPPVVTRHPDAAGWVLAEFRPTPTHRMAVAARPFPSDDCSCTVRRVRP